MAIIASRSLTPAAGHPPTKSRRERGRRLPSQLLLDHRPPREQREFLGALDQGVFAADKLHGLPVGACNPLAALRDVECLAALLGQLLARTDAFDLTGSPLAWR